MTANEKHNHVKEREIYIHKRKAEDELWAGQVSRVRADGIQGFVLEELIWPARVSDCARFLGGRSHLAPWPFPQSLFSATREIGRGLINIQLFGVCYYTAIDGWYNYTQCHLAKWLCNSNEFLFKQPLVIVWKWKTARETVNRVDNAKTFVYKSDYADTASDQNKSHFNLSNEHLLKSRWVLGLKKTDLIMHAPSCDLFPPPRDKVTRTSIDQSSL